MNLKNLPLLFVAIPFLSSAQDSTFQLKDYKYRTPGFKALSVNFSLSGSLSESNQSAGNEYLNKSFDIGPSYLTYNKIVSTNQRLHQSNASLLPRFYSSKQASPSEEKSQRLFSTSLQWARSDRFYKRNLWFIEFGNILEVTGDKSRRDQVALITTDNRAIIKNTASIGVGKGRIEQVQDAQMAMYILKDLKEQGLLDSDIDPEVSNAFAQLITDINNRRIFDFRRRRVYELTRIDSFLTATRLVGKTDIRHFTTLNDNWSFAINPFRMHGTAWFARLKPGIGYSRFYAQWKSTSTSENTSENFAWSLAPELGVEKYVAVNLKWQQSLGASLSYERTRERVIQKTVSAGSSSQTQSDGYASEVSARGFAGLGYFPNTRTQVGVNLVATAGYSNDKAFKFSPNLYLFANYFIGYRTYLNANGSIQYNDYESPTLAYNNILNLHFGVSISHILF